MNSCVHIPIFKNYQQFCQSCFTYTFHYFFPKSKYQASCHFTNKYLTIHHYYPQELIASSVLSII